MSAVLGFWRSRAQPIIREVLAATAGQTEEGRSRGRLAPAIVAAQRLFGRAESRPPFDIQPR